MAQNMYRVGDYVYFEITSAAPFQVRRIEELNKTATGNVEAKVMCFYRRRDISPALLRVADNATPEGMTRSGNSRWGHAVADKSGKRVLADGDRGEGKTGESAATESGKVEENGEATARAGSESPRPMLVDEGEDDKPPDGDDVASKEKDEEKEENVGEAGLPHDKEPLTKAQRHLLRQRELFLSRQIETLPATHIRGKCVVTLLSEVETPDSYLSRDDAFFYSLVYDPQAKTLLADKGEIRVGEKYQSRVPAWDHEGRTRNEEESDAMQIEKGLDDETPATAVSAPALTIPIPTTPRETLVYHPFHTLTDRDIDQFLIVARAVGTFSRALDTSSSVKLPSLHMTAAAASRDVTLLHAMALLHHANYDLGQAMKFLVPPPSKQHYPLDADKTTAHNTVSLGGPILCRDQMEEWSAAEANLFEEAIDKYGKDFNDIRQDFLPWKALKDIVEYYYMWKTTNRYVDSKRSKAAEAESRLKQVYIPNYNKPNPNLVGPPNPSGQPQKGTLPCESCRSRNGGNASALSGKHGNALTGGLGRGGLAASAMPATGPLNLHAQKPRMAFFLHTTLITRIARRLAPKALLNVRKCARRPFVAIQGQLIKQNCQARDPQEILRVARQLRGGRLAPGMFEALSQAQASGVGLSSSIATAGGAASAKRPLANGDKAAAPPAKRPAAGHHGLIASSTIAPITTHTTHSLLSSSSMINADTVTIPQAIAANCTGRVAQAIDSRWHATAERILFLAGPQLKKTRRAVCSRRDARRAVLSPCKQHATLENAWPTMNALWSPP